MSFSVLSHRDALGVTERRNLIDGAWVDGTGPVLDHVHPATNERVTQLRTASAEDVDRAVRAARRAFDEGRWPRLPARDRRRILQRISQAIAEHTDEINRLQTLDNGLPVSFASVYQLSAEIAVDLFDHHAGWVDKLSGDTLPSYRDEDVFALTLREPVGVVGAILPWNAPVMLFAQKVAPALAAGCTVVLKPSELASLAVVRMCELIDGCDLPPGVFNVVLGDGPTTGEALVTHPLVDKVTFTGSRAVGGHILEASGRDIKRVSLELGGKSPQIIFPDAPDIKIAAMMAMGGVSYGMSGQGCVIMTRTLVHEDIYDECVQVAADFAGVTRYGDPFDPSVTSMPLISPRQLAKVEDYIAAGHDEGARLVVGGDRPDDPELAQGNYVNPTLFADVDNSMTIAQEEIFGPVLSMIPFRDDEEALQLANATDYGLGASIWTTDVRRAMRFAKAVRAGTFGINSQTVLPNIPFGGYKRSGIGREGGMQGIEAFTEVKLVTIGNGDTFPI